MVSSGSVALTEISPKSPLACAHEPRLEKAVLTLAAGKSTYFSMALNLARSFERWNGDNGLRLFIVTDLDLHLPRDLNHTVLVRVARERLPKGFSAKLWLDRFDVAEKCLFIDADCLVLGSLESVFAAFDGKAVGVFGDVIVDGEWFGDVAETCKKLQIPWRPRFNGGIYYFERGDLAEKVYSLARNLEGAYDAIGFVRLRGQPDEEMLVGAALAKCGIRPVLNDGRYYADFQWWPVLERLSIARGECHMRNPPPGEINHQSYYPADNAAPLIVHFLGHHVTSVLYRRCALELFLLGNRIPAAAFIARCAFLHLDIWIVLKDLLRPFYRCLFGHRAVKPDKQRYHVQSH